MSACGIVTLQNRPPKKWALFFSLRRKWFAFYFFWERILHSCEWHSHNLTHTQNECLLVTFSGGSFSRFFLDTFSILVFRSFSFSPWALDDYFSLHHTEETCTIFLSLLISFCLFFYCYNALKRQKKKKYWTLLRTRTGWLDSLYSVVFPLVWVCGCLLPGI
jgi:hypothetical protein